MRKALLGSIVLTLTLAVALPVAQAELSYLQKMNYIDNVTPAGSCGVDIHVKNRAGFDQAAAVQKGNEIHVTLPGSYTHPPVRMFKGLDKTCFKQAVVAQIDKNHVRAVLTLRDNYAGATTPALDLDGNALHVRLGQPVPPVAAAAPAAAVPPEAKVDLAKIFGDDQSETAADDNTADAPPATTLSTETERPPMWSDAAIKMTVALAVSLAGLMGLVALAKKFKLPHRLTGGRTGLIKVVQTGMIDMKHRIAVVDVAGELIVVALTPNGMTMLTKIESPAARERLTQSDEEDFAPPQPERDPQRPRAVEPEAFGREKAVVAAGAASFNAKLRAYTRHAPPESATVGQQTLQTIADRVKRLKKL